MDFKWSCNPWCAAAIAFTVSSIILSLNSGKTQSVRSLVSSLNAQQKERYDLIASARGKIYATGLGIGSVLAGFYIWTQQRSSSPPIASRAVCQFIVILELVAYMYYILAPKPELLVVSLANERLREKWASAYRSMQWRHHGAFALAAVAVASAGMVICRS